MSSSVYDSGASAYRDTAKWLVAFVPIASLLAAAGVVGPALVQSGAEAGSLPTWLAANALTLVALAVMALGMTIVITAGAKVLAAQPAGLASVLATTSDDAGARLAAAFGEGLGVPYYYDSAPFLTDLRKMSARDAQVTEDVAHRAVTTLATVREWALHQELSTLFSAFVVRFLVGVGLVAAGFLVAASTVEDPAASRREPVPVALVAPADAAADFEEHLGCPPVGPQLWLVDGTWEEPVLEADGPGCAIGKTWEPQEEHVVRLRPALR